ncbi:hypothetical protein M0805_004929 [Coniferiporia weirii]|nr:hypothetical protein M0805_004929 [Coniferiporia weirii]
MAPKASSSLPPSKKQKTGASSYASSSPLQTITALESSVSAALDANASLNPLADLLHIAVAPPDEDVEVALKAIFALYRLFTLISQKGILIVSADESGDRKLVRTWIVARLGAFVELLCALLNDEDKTLRISSLKILFSLLRQLSSSVGKSGEASSSAAILHFDVPFFKKIVHALLTCPASPRTSRVRKGNSKGQKDKKDMDNVHEGEVLNADVRDLFLDTWLNVYTDIRWFFLRETATLLENPVLISAHPFLPANALSILEKLTGMPSTDTISSDPDPSLKSQKPQFWIEELNTKPKPRRSNKLSSNPESGSESESENDDGGEQDKGEDDWRLFFEDTNPSKDTKTSKQKNGTGKGRRLHTLTIHAQLHTPIAHRAVFTRSWLALLPHLSGISIASNGKKGRGREDEDEERARLALVSRALTVLHHGVLPHLTRAVLVMDWVAGCVDHGGSVGLLALNALFVLMREYNLDYPQFYTRLYAFLDRNVLHLRYRARFFRLTELFLSSSHLPATLLASFVKRLARLSLSAPPAAIIMAIPFTYNILKRHPALMSMIHRVESDSDQNSEAIDPFLAAEPNPTQTGALQSSLWELATHRYHYHSSVATLARVLEAAFTRPAYGMEDFLDHTYATLFDTEVNRKIKREPALAELEFTNPLVVRTGETVTGADEVDSEVQMDVVSSMWVFA